MESDIQTQVNDTALEIVAECGRIMAQQNLRIAFVESATAGWMASEFSLIPDSGKVFLGGLVCYDADTKKDLFGITDEMIEQYTPESAEVTKLLAEGLGNYFKSDIAVAVTGLTAPGGSETREKPVGTIFLHIILPGNRYCAHREVFHGSPKEIINQTIERTGKLLTELLKVNSKNLVL